MKITIDNFLRMTPELPQYGQNSKHYLVAGANPTYYLDSTGIEEEQVAPLIASLDWIQTSGVTIDGSVVHIVASTEGTYSVYFVTDTTHVYGATTSSITDLGYPTGSSINNSSGRLACANNTLFFSLTSLSLIYKMTQPSSSWTTCVGTALQTNSGIKFIEPFLDFIAVSDSTSSNTTGHLIGILNTTSFNYTTVGSIDIGLGWGIAGMTNLNNKYLVIAASQTKYGIFFSNYSQNYLFIWNGIDARYTFSVKIPGKYIHMKVIDSILYVAVQTNSGKSVIYYLSGTTLRKYKTPQYAQVATYGIVPQPLFNYNNYIGVNLSFGPEVNNPLMIMGKDEAGDVEFILSHNRTFQTFAIGFDSVLFGSVAPAVGNDSTLWYYPQSNTLFQKIVYVSLWIPVRNLSAIDIFYDTPPQSGNDAIHTTIYGRGEDIQSGFSTTILNDIIPTTILNNTRTRLDVQGFTGDLVKIKITTDNTTWRPNIRKIVLLDSRQTQ